MNNLEPIKGMRPQLDRDAIVARVADSLRDGDQAAALETWSQLVKSLAESGSGLSESDINALIQQTVQQAGAGSDSLTAKSVEALESEIKSLEEQLNTVGDDAQLANLDLQNMLQKQQQTLQMLSTISKMLHDTAMAVIRKIGG